MIFPLLVSCSYGNDSVALVQWLFETGWSAAGAAVIYADTGWASDGWPARVDRCEAWARGIGFETMRTSSLGFADLVRRKKSWPRQGIQFCTQHLKVEPLNLVQDVLDPARAAVVCIGKRREESANRAETPEWIESDPYNGGRAVWHPLFLHDHAERDALLARAGFEPLAHRSDECWPCINSNKADLMRLAADPARVERIRLLEQEMGLTSKGKPRTMFRPHRHRGATGIDAMLRWAATDRGAEFNDGTGDDCQFTSAGCGI